MEVAMTAVFSHRTGNTYRASIVLTALLPLLMILAMPVTSWAHGFAGKRFFPTTLSVEDPFVSDELSFLFGHIKEDSVTKTTSLGLDYSKRITPHFGISIGSEYQTVDVNHVGSESGFGNLELGIKYQFLTSELHEAILSVGVGAEIGRTGSRRIGAESFSIISPALFFGKGFGDLPDSVKYLKPFAITGVIGPNFPTRTKTVSDGEVEYNPDKFSWGITLQYSLQYLQSFVTDIGLGAPLNRTVLLLEFPMETCLNRGCKGQTTGFVNPGITWVGKTMQFGIEAQIPINERSGNHVGVLGLVHFFLDDMFPKSLGRPIFP
jgi:hypothetical protein